MGLFWSGEKGPEAEGLEWGLGAFNGMGLERKKNGIELTQRLSLDVTAQEKKICVAGQKRS